MPFGARWLAIGLVIASIAFSGCRQAPAAPAKSGGPAKIERIEGTDLSRLTLSEKAVERLGIATEVVCEARGSTIRGAASESTLVGRTTIPYSAVVYDAGGDTWTYTNPQPLVFVRQHIVVDYVEAGVAILVEGPPPSTAVVTVGAPELFGAEFGVSH